MDNYFDKIFSICSYSYLNELLSYNKILKQRNSLLRTEKNTIKKQKEIERKIVTKIIKVKKFYEAEEYHQKYLMKRGRNTC